MTKAKKITYLVVIGVGVSGLILDRVLRSGSSATPARASASENPVPAAGTETESEDSASIFALEVTPFPADLPPVGDTFRGRDPFEMTDSVLKQLSLSIPAEQEQSAEESPDSSPRESFQTRHRLSAVMRVGKTQIAVLDGMVLAKGQWLDDCELIQIEDRAVHFDCPDGEVVLTIDE